MEGIESTNQELSRATDGQTSDIESLSHSPIPTEEFIQKGFFLFFFKTQTIAISVDDSSIITHHNIEEKEVLAEPGSVSESGAAHHEEVIKIDFVN